MRKPWGFGGGGGGGGGRRGWWGWGGGATGAPTPRLVGGFFFKFLQSLGDFGVLRLHKPNKPPRRMESKKWYI